MHSILDAWQGFEYAPASPILISIPFPTTSQATNKNVRNNMKSEAYQSGKNQLTGFSIALYEKIKMKEVCWSVH